MAAEQVGYYNPGVQAGAGQGLGHQHSGPYAAEVPEGAANLPAGGLAYHLDAHAHDEGLAGAAAGSSVEVGEPVFSDVSGLEPVYNFRVRSSYNNGRVMYVRTSYHPADSDVMPVYHQHTHASQNVNANDQVKARPSGF